MRIYKYELGVTDEQHILMPADSVSRVLSVGAQDGRIFIWALVDETAQKAPVKFYIVGTGNPADHIFKAGVKFIGTVQIPPFVWHVFAVEATFDDSGRRRS